MLYILVTRKRTDKFIYGQRGRAGARADFPHLPSLSSPSPLPSRLLSISTPALCSGQRSSPCPRHSTPPPFDSLCQAHLPTGRIFLATHLPPKNSGRRSFLAAHLLHRTHEQQQGAADGRQHRHARLHISFAGRTAAAGSRPLWHISAVPLLFVLHSREQGAGIKYSPP